MWKNGTIGDVLSVIQNGINCNQNKIGKGLKITRIETIADANINYHKTGFSNLDENKKQKAALKKGDILFSHINSPIHVGKTAIYDGKEPLYHGINLLRLNTIEAVDSRYLNFFLQSLFWNGYWKRTAKQSVNQASVNQTDIKKIPFSYPLLAEQQRIISKLDIAFKEIDKANEVTNKNNDNVKLVFEKYLLDVFENKRKNWRSESLKDVSINITDGKHGDSKNQPMSGYFFLSAKDVRRGTLNYNDAREITKNDFDETHRRTNLEPGDILITNSGTIGRMAIAPESELTAKTTFQKSVAIIKPRKDKLESSFLYFLLTSKLYYFQKVSQGTAQKNLLLRDLRAFDIAYPVSLNEQLVIAKKIKSISTFCKNLEIILNTKTKELHALKLSILAQELQSKVV